MQRDQQKEVVVRATNELGQNLDSTLVVSILSMVASHCVDI